MAVEAVVLTKCKCNNCGHEWYPRKERLPEQCPWCQSPKWNEEDRGE